MLRLQGRGPVLIIEREVRLYVTPEGKIPYNDWFYSLRDGKAVHVIRARLARLRAGNWGDYKSAGEGVLELRIDFGPGYRIYCGMDGHKIIILLCGGDKHSQDKDIRKALNHWADYKRRR